MHATKVNRTKLSRRRGTNPRRKKSNVVINEFVIMRLCLTLFVIVLMIGFYIFCHFTSVKGTSSESAATTYGNSSAHFASIAKFNKLMMFRGGSDAVGDIISADSTKENNNRQPYFNESSYLETFPYKFNSTLDMSHYKPKGGNRFREWKDGDTPYKITDQVRFASDKAARVRREHIKNSMKHAWNGYKEHAFGFDEVEPVSGGSNQRWAGIGTTLVDSLDTLWVMNLKDEFYEARDWVRDKLDFNKDKFISVFETTIRSLGGLLGAYDRSGDEAFLEKATDLGERIFKAFDSPTGIAYGEVNLKTGHGRNEGWLHDEVSTAAGTTLQVEYRYLAEATGRHEFAKKAERAFVLLHGMEPADGLYPATVINTHGPQFGRKERKVSFGSRADSFYEYMLKIWLQGNKKEHMYRDMYDRSMQGMHDKLLQKGDNGEGLWYIAQSTYNTKGDYHHLNPSMDHLVCFMGGLLALGAYTDPEGLDSPRAQRDLKTGKALTYSCYQMYASTATGLSPEIVASWNGGAPQPDRGALFYILRPEAVESFFILHQLTGDPIYREFGWEVYQSIEKYCKTKIAYGHYPDVTNPRRSPENHMESFFLGETMKYLYLLMDPDTDIDILHKHVFNTEAHPLSFLHSS